MQIGDLVKTKKATDACKHFCGIIIEELPYNKVSVSFVFHNEIYVNQVNISDLILLSQHTTEDVR